MSSKTTQQTLHFNGSFIRRDATERWTDALETYRMETGQDLLQHSFAINLLSQSTTDEVMAQLQKFMDFRTRGHKILSVLKPIVSVVMRFTDAGAEGASKAAPGGKAIFVACGALLQAMKGVSHLYDTVEALLQRVRDYIERVAIHLKPLTPPSPAVMRILLYMLVQVLKVLAIVTKYCGIAKEGDSRFRKATKVLSRRAKDYVLVLSDKTDLADALKKLEQFANSELQLTTAHTNAIAREVQPKVVAIYDSTVINDLRSWLRPTNPQPRNYERKRKADSCKWFFDARFEEWKAQQNGLYWVHGNAGSGKSVLCSSVIETLKADPALFLAYFYFDFSDPEKQDCRALVSSLVFQIGTQFEECLHYLKGERSSDPPTFETLLAMLSRLLSLSGRTFIVIDAVDECPEPEREAGLQGFLEHICSLDRVGVDLRLLVTARPEGDIGRHISRFATQILSFHNNHGHKKDLEQYITSRLSDSDLYHWSDRVKEKAQRKLTEGSHGMFLWVDLQLQQLRHCAPRDVDATLKQMPSDLNQTYERILTKFPNQTAMANRARYVFECVAFARRPLTPIEVFCVFSANFDSAADSRSDMSLHVPDEDLESLIFQRCPGLLDIITSEKGHKVVQFIHFSVLEYLMSADLRQSTSSARLYSFDEDSANLTLARICISSLDTEGSLLTFQTYANEYWDSHVNPQNDDALGGVLRGFLDLDSPSFTRWARTRCDWLGQFDTAFHWAVRLGLRRHVDRILQRAGDDPVLLVGDAVRARGRWRQTALHVAATHGYAEILRLLLEHGAYVLDPDYWGNIPLHCAASSGHSEIAVILLEYPSASGLDSTAGQLSAKDTYGRTPLHKAAKWGHIDVCRCLLDHQTFADATANDGNTALLDAVESGRLNVVRLLLKWPAANGSNVAAHRCRMPRHDGQTALHRAAQQGHMEIARLLLDNGAPIDGTDNNGDTPLHISASYGQLNIVCMLLENPAADGSCAATLRCRARNRHGQTALHHAALRGHAEVSRILLNYGSLIDAAEEQYGHIPLLSAAMSRDLTTVLVFLEHSLEGFKGSDTGSVQYHNAKDGWTALHLAVEHGPVEISRVLLDHGALIDVVDHRGRTPLHHAATIGLPDVVRFLLEYPAAYSTAASRSSACCRDGKNALHYAAGNGRLEACHILLEHGVPVDDTDHGGRTPLDVAEEHGQMHIVRILSEHRLTSGPREAPFASALEA